MGANLVRRVTVQMNPLPWAALPRLNARHSCRPAKCHALLVEVINLDSNTVTLCTDSTADDFVLGPAKAAFGSSRSTHRLKDGEGLPAYNPDNENAIEDDSKSRNWGDRERNPRGAMKDGAGWTSVRGGRNVRSSFLEQDMKSRRILRDQVLDQTRDAEDGQNRQRWTREGDRNAPRQSTQGGGWRDRNEGPKRFDRDQGRSAFDRDPEWMEQSTGGDDSQAHTAAEFELWKERMRASKAQQDGKDAPSDTPSLNSSRPPAITSVSTSSIPAYLGANTGLNGLSMGGTWGNSGPHATELPSLGGLGSQDVPAQRPTPAQTKAKASRFASIFNPAKENDSMGSAEPSPHVPPVQYIAPPQNGNDEQAGFQRMMQMLRGTSVSAEQNGGIVSPPSIRPEPTAQNHSGRLTQPSPGPNTLQNASPALSVLHEPSRNNDRPASGGLNKDTEFLLNLIQAKNPSPGPGFQGGVAPPPGFGQPPSHHNEGPPFGALDRLNPTQHPSRPPPGFFELNNNNQSRAPPPGLGATLGHADDQVRKSQLPPLQGPQQGFEGGPPGPPPGQLDGFPPGMRLPQGGFGRNEYMGGMPPPPPGFFGPGPPVGNHAPNMMPPGFGQQPLLPPGSEEFMRNPVQGQRGAPPGFGL